MIDNFLGIDTEGCVCVCVGGGGGGTLDSMVFAI